MNWLAGLYVIALTIALCVQTLVSPLAGAWLFFFLAACLCFYRPDSYRNIVWFWCLAWLASIGASTFILAPVSNGAATMWILAAMPLLALCSMKAENLEKCLGYSLIAITLYAFGLCLQLVLHIRFDHFEYASRYIPGAGAFAWPLLDPNNAALVINAAFIPCLYQALRKPKWGFLCVIFVAAMVATASKAGAVVGALMAAVLVWEKFGLSATPGLLGAIGAGLLIFHAPLLASLRDRLPIWKASLPLLTIHPLTGLGLGTFSYYYRQLRTETYTSGIYAHNDILQFAVEMGIPAAVLFCGLTIAMLLKTSRKNIVSACVFMAVFLQSMVEFQFYLPSISILAGLALAHHIKRDCELT